MEEPQATVREINGQLVLDDPAAIGVMRAVSKHNCRRTFDAQVDRVDHFKRRIGFALLPAKTRRFWCKSALCTFTYPPARLATIKSEIILTPTCAFERHRLTYSSVEHR